MYKKRDNLLFGFHGCDEAICDALVSGKQKVLNFSVDKLLIILYYIWVADRGY